MEPILSKLEKKRGDVDQAGSFYTIDDVTSVGRVARYSLLRPDISLQTGTKFTAAARETTDDD